MFAVSIVLYIYCVIYISFPFLPYFDGTVLQLDLISCGEQSSSSDVETAAMATSKQFKKCSFYSYTVTDVTRKSLNNLYIKRDIFGVPFGCAYLVLVP